MVSIVNDAQARKLGAILTAYRNGNMKDAASRVRKLTKRELVKLLLANHQLPEGFLCDPGPAYDFESFVERALEGYGE